MVILYVSYGTVKTKDPERLTQHMQSKSKIGILGGDSRQLAVGAMFADNGFECAIWGCDASISSSMSKGMVKCVDWKCAVSSADAIILPWPLTTDGVRLNCGKNTENREIYIPRITEIIQHTDRSCVLFGGKVPISVKRFADEHNIRLVDYYEFEDFQIKNAVPTAEGAIGIAIKELDVTLAGAKAAIVGYGRIGRTLSQRLVSLGCIVTCIARSRKDLAWAECDGCSALHLTGFKSKPESFDIIFNTAPHIIFDEGILKKLSRETLIVDLASQNGGVDSTAAEKYGIKVIKALSLPGKTSPITAGKIIYETVMSVLGEEGLI